MVAAVTWNVCAVCSSDQWRVAFSSRIAMRFDERIKTALRRLVDSRLRCGHTGVLCPQGGLPDTILCEENL